MFEFQIINHLTLQAAFEEYKVVSMLNNDENLYGMAEIVSMTAFEITMSLGGSEGMVQSFIA